MRCLRCGFANPEGMKFCIKCAALLPLRCAACGFDNPPEAVFCGQCATPLTQQSGGRGPEAEVSAVQPPTLSTQPPVNYTPKHLAERILAEQTALEARAVPDGERKTIAALFADIKDSTALIEDLDPEEARRLVDPALALMMEAVHRYEGYVSQALGDGIFALFGAPIAHEDHPQRALYAALHMQEGSKRYAEQLRREHGINLQVRVGVNTGEVVVRSIRKDDLHTDYVPIGHSTNLASRMEGLAHGGGIIVSEHTYKLTEGYFEFKPLGKTRIKGVSEPLDVYEVLGVGPLRTRLQVGARRGLVRFVGRQHELEQLRRALQSARAGRGQVVAVMGEPGVGKSRLFHEFVGAHGQRQNQTEAVPLHPDGCLVLEAFSVSHGKAYPCLPLIDLLKNYFQITLHDDERRQREKVMGKVLALDRSLEDTLPYLLFLLGIAESASSLAQMDLQIRRRRTFEAIKRLLVRESLNQSLILIFEDLHWLDTETQAFLTLLNESLATARMLLLVNYRPEYRHDWGNKTYYTQLRLDPLGPADAQELLTALLGDEVPLQPLKRVILEKTEGNPFFIEEIVQDLFEQKVLVRDPVVGAKLRPGLATGHLPSSLGRVSLALTDLHLPTTVQGVLAARIDRLPPEEKELLQTLAVIGKEFPLSLLARVVDKAGEGLSELLSHLRETEFIYEQPAFPEVEYTFKHALTQEVAYGSVLHERRKALHERTAAAMEGLYRATLEDHYGELAHHYSLSGNTQKAVEYLQLAGQQAMQRSANAEALSHLTRALELLKTLPDTPERTQQELALQIALGVALSVTKGFAAPEVGRAYTRARHLCGQVGDTPQLLSVLFGLWVFYLTRGEYRKGRELAEQLLHAAQRVQDPIPLVAAHYMLGATQHLLGELTPARAYLEQGITLYNPSQHRSHTSLYGFDTGMTCLIWLALALWHLGYPDQALQRMREALTLAQGQAHPFGLAIVLAFAAWLHQYRREGQESRERAEAMIALAHEQGLLLYSAWGTILRGWALAAQSQEKEGIAQMREGLAAYRTTGAEENGQTWFLAWLAEAYGRAGQVEEGLNVLAEALAGAHRTGECVDEAELHRLKGELTLKSQVQGPKPVLSLVEGPQVEKGAEECFLKAIEITRRQQAKSLELRAVMSLSRLWQQQGKKEEARQLLAEIYGWFIEGFETADLQEARALLETLST